MDNIVFGVMTTFFPTKLSIQNAIAISEQCNLLVVVDDTGVHSEGIDIYEELKYAKNIVTLQNKKNLGIAYALNIGIQYSLNNGADYIVTFDDDTQICENYVKQCLDFYRINEKKIGAVSLSRGTAFTGGTAIATAKRTLITSGFFTSAKMYKDNDIIPEDYFIDLVDFYASLKIRSLGYKIYVLDRVGMIHTVGNLEVRRFLFYFNIYNHSPFRLYYQVRNCILFFKDFWLVDFTFCFYLLLDVVRIPLKALFFETRKFSRLAFCFRGFCDGILSRRGKLNE